MGRSGLYTNAGIVIGALAVIMAMMAGGGGMVFVNWESFAITVLGSFSALLINYSWDDAVTLLQETKELLKETSPDPVSTIEQFSDLATRARREGLLVLEDEIPKMNPFLGKGLQMVIDGMDSTAVSKVLETELAQVEGRHSLCANMLGTWANLAPGFGMIGTLVGLIKMLKNLSDPSTIGPSMAIALVTTFYGAVMANYILTPLAGKVAFRSRQVLLYREMVIEGLTALQAGVNPRVIEQRLKAFVLPVNRKQPVLKVAEEAADD